jgi:hypothetical protein
MFLVSKRCYTRLLRYSSAKYWFSGANWSDQLTDVISSLIDYVIGNLIIIIGRSCNHFILELFR